ncbi:MAG: hypothetical protein ACLPY5_16230 [Candidatus Bathyarchaeia archaeon]
MAKIDLTPLLRGDLAETYFKHFSIDRGYAYARAEDVGWDLLHHNVVIFKHGFRRVPIKIPFELSRFLIDVVRPSNRSTMSPSYPFDFITCRVTQDEMDTQRDDRTLQGKRSSDFTIVEVKSGQSVLTRREMELQQRCNNEPGIRYALYRISEIDKSPREWDLIGGYV